MAKFINFYILFVFLACSLWSCDDTPRKPTDVDAQFMAQSVVKAQLIDPDNAEFINGNSKMQIFTDSSWVFDGYVKTTNKLGLKAPTEYNVGIKWNGGDPDDYKNWTIKFCNFPDL